MAHRDELKDVFVPIHQFDKNRIRILDPVTHTFTKGDTEIEWTTSEGRYIDDDGNECELFFEAPEQFSFGINGVYPIGTDRDSRCLENMVGLQVCYLLTSMKTIENPTANEQYICDVFQALQDATWEKMQEECEKEELLVPNPSYNAYLAATKRNNPWHAVKPVFAFPQMKDPENSKKKIEDRSKPRRVYAKLLTKGEGRKMRCITQIYGPEDRQDTTGLKYLDKRGAIYPVFKWEGIFWGSHGQKASYGASVRLRIAQMNFIPQLDGVPARRMLPPNTASAVVEHDFSSGDERVSREGREQTTSDEEDEGFVKPGDDENPMDALNNKKGDSDDESAKPRTKKSSSERRKELLKKKKATKKNVGKT